MPLRTIGQVAVLAAAVLVRCSDSRAQTHPLTVEDILRTENFGPVAALASDGHFAVYEWLRPYATNPSFATFGEQLADPDALAQLFIVDLQRRSKARPLFNQHRSAGYWLGPISPDGTRIALFSLVGGKVKAGVFTFTTGRLRWFPFAPQYTTQISPVQSPVWISNDELVYATIPNGQEPPIVGRRRHVRRATDLWAKAFRGREPSATELTSASTRVVAATNLRPGRLVRVSARTGVVVTLGEGSFHSLRLSPGRQHLGALRDGEWIQGKPDEPFASFGLRRQLLLFDLRSNEGEKAQRIPCANCDVVIGAIQWSADGSRVVFLARPVGERVEAAQVYEYTVATGALERLRADELQLSCRVSATAGLSHERPVALGNGVAVFARPGVSTSQCLEARGDWYLLSTSRTPVNLTSQFKAISSEPVGMTREGLFVVADDGVWLIGADAGSRNLTAGINGPLQSVVGGLSGVGRRTEMDFTGHSVPTARAVLESPSQILRFDLQHARYSLIPKPTPDAAILGVAPGADVALVREDLAGHSTLSVVGDGRQARMIANINMHLDSVARPRQVRIAYAVGGDSLSSCALLPPDWRSTRRYPLVVEVYPGTPTRAGECLSEAGSLNQFSLDLLAAHGYIVLRAATPADLSGTSAGPTLGAARLVLAAVDQAINDGYADPDRLGIYGFSQGFRAVLEIITTTTRFRAAVVSHGVSDVTSHYGTSALRERLDWVDNGVGSVARYENAFPPDGMDGSLVDQLNRYVRNSPAFFVNKIQTPLLIFHSDFDVFPLGQSEELFTGLYRLGKEATYITYWGEGHGPSSPANIRHMWKRIFEWFDTHLVAGVGGLGATRQR